MMEKPLRNEDYDLKQAWEQACDAFAKSSGEQLNVKTKYTPEEVLEQIRAKQEKNDEKAAKYKVVKEVLSKTLDCIDNLGNIAAQGASMVFGPAGFAGNALSYLIATGAKYKYIFNSLAELFTKISNFLERFKIYFRMPDVDIALRVIINELLVCFVSICGLSIKVLKGNKALLYLKVFAFSDDAGVSAKLQQLADLVEKEREMRATLGYEVEKKIEQSVAAGRQETKEGIRALNSAVNEMAEQEKKREASTILAKQLEAIEKALDRPSDNYKSIYQNFVEKRVESTGEWLQQNTKYSDWVLSQPASASVLCLAGGEGYGKSFLTSTVVQDLRKRYPQGDVNATRTSVAYYYFQREGKGSKSEKDALSLGTALKSLAWQIAKTDTVYRKDLHAVCERIEDAQVSELWNVLFAQSYRSDATFFLVFDGTDQMEEKHLKAFSQLLQDAATINARADEKTSLCLRILLSGRNKLIEDITADTKASIIDLASSNRDDIEKFVLDGIANIKILGGALPADQARRDEIFAALTKNAKGDFISVDLLLKQIAEKRRTAEMLQILEQFQGEDRTDTIARTIEGLNKSLSKQDILDLNEILVWCISGRQRMTVAELDAILRKKNGEDDYSLQPLAEAIEERYSKLLTVDPEIDPLTKVASMFRVVDVVSESIRDYLVSMNVESEEDGDSSSGKKSSKDGDVNESEVKIVKRFLESVCDPELFTKFQFEQFFQAKLTTSTAVIQFDEQASQLKIVSTCIDGIINHDPIWEIIMPYFTSYFHVHLAAIDLSLTIPREKTVVGGNIIKLFSDESVIPRWCTEYSLLQLRQDWLLDETYTDVVLNWFKDSAVIKGLDGNGKQWAKDLTSNARPEADLLEYIARFVASKWLRDSFWDLNSVVLFVHSYVCKVENRFDSTFGKDWQTRFVLTDIPLSEIQAMLKWTKEKLGIEELGYEETRNLARTYRDCRQFEQALESFADAITKKEDNWLCRWGLSIAYSEQKDWPHAIETLKGVIKSIETGEAKEDDPQDSLPEMRRELAQFLKESGNADGAVEMYRSILEKTPDDMDSTSEFISYLAESKRYVELVELINKLRTTRKTVEDVEVDHLTLLYQEFAQFQTFHDMLTSAAYEGKFLGEIDDGYVNAVRATIAAGALLSAETWSSEREQVLYKTTALTFQYGTFLYQTQHRTSWRQDSVDQWKRVLAIECPNEHYTTYWMANARTELAYAYSLLARQFPKDSDEAKENVAHIRGLYLKPDEAIYNQNVEISQALARYMAAVGDKQQAKEVLRTEVNLNLQMLSDDDPENDYVGYKGLAICLMFAGDWELARAAWSLITPYEIDGELPERPIIASKSTTTPAVDDDKASVPATSIVTHGEAESKGESDGTTAEARINSEEVTKASGDDVRSHDIETDKKAESEIIVLDGPLWNRCDGCRVDFKYSDTFYWCVDCNDKQWCVECLPKLRNDTITRRVCGKDHEMFELPRYDPKRLKEIGKGNVAIGDRVVSVKEWVDEVRNLWNVVKTEGLD